MFAFVFAAILIIFFGLLSAAPWWLPPAWRNTIGWLSLSEAERLYVEMICDLTEEANWKPCPPRTFLGKAGYLHQDSGIVLRFQYNRAEIEIDGSSRRFSNWHPIYSHAKRVERYVLSEAERRSQLEDLQKISAAFRTMNAQVDGNPKGEDSEAG